MSRQNGIDESVRKESSKKLREEVMATIQKIKQSAGAVERLGLVLGSGNHRSLEIA